MKTIKLEEIRQTKKLLESIITKINDANGITNDDTMVYYGNKTEMIESFYETLEWLDELMYDDMQCIATMSFVNDAEKMLDFSTLSKDEFLKSYSYIKESEYNATVDYMKFLNAIGKE